MADYTGSSRQGYGRRPGYPNGYDGNSETSLSQDRNEDDRRNHQTSPSRPPFQPRSQRRVEPIGAVNPYGGDNYNQENGRQERERSAPAVARPISLERKQANRRSGGHPGQRSPTRRTANGDGGRQVDEVLSQIKRDWSFMTDDRCVPVQVGLQLMDSSSLGLAARYDHFRQVHQQLQNSLKAIVNEHHQGFNSSIGTYHSIQNSIHTSQQRLRQLRDNLGQAKVSLATTKPELKGLAAGSRNYDEMLQALSTIEHLQSIPEKLEAKISEKRFLGAVDLLQDALRSMRRSELDNIGALADLRAYLNSQEHSLAEILIEELHNHLYLKSPYCEDRWKDYATVSSGGTGVGDGSETVSLGGRKIFHFLDRLDTSKPMQETLSGTPEADTFVYIHLLIEALNKLGRLEDSVDSITQRLPVELYKVVEKCNQEVDQRYPSSVRNVKKSGDPFDFTSDVRMPVLNDLLDRLYARFEAIAESHRAVHEVISGIAKREGIRASTALIGGFREVWKLYQSEIRSLLHDYLATDGHSSFRSSQNKRASSVFNRAPRDKTRRIFKLSDVDDRSSELSAERDDLDFILKSSVPGLVLNSKRPGPSTQTNSFNGTDGSATGHRLLVEPSVFNMGILLPPSLAFLQRMKNVVPAASDAGIGSLTSFLDDFLLNVFLPQMEETLVDLSAQAFIEADAFHQDPSWRKYSKQPIFRGTVKFFTLVTAFCRLLDKLPHDQAFSQLLVGQLIIYYDKCYGWFKSMVMRAQPHPQTGSQIKIGAALTDSGAVHDILVELAAAGVGDGTVLLHKETELLLQTFDEVNLEQSDVIGNEKIIDSLCLLHSSMTWLASRTSQLRHISTQATDSSRRDSTTRITPHRRWTIIAATETPSDRIYLPLSQETAQEFDSLTQSYRQLAALVLRTLHTDLRSQIALNIKQALSRTFDVEQPFTEPDPEILSLNADVTGYDEAYGVHLSRQEHAFITKGLAHFIDNLLVNLTTTLPIMNQNGCGRLQLNILVLQQNLKNIESGANLTRSALFLDLFAAGPEAIVSQAKEQSVVASGGGNGGQRVSRGGHAGGEEDVRFSRRELERLVELWYSVGLKSERREVAVQARRGLDDCVLQVSEFVW